MDNSGSKENRQAQHAANTVTPASKGHPDSNRPSKPSRHPPAPLLAWAVGAALGIALEDAFESLAPALHLSLWLSILLLSLLLQIRQLQRPSRSTPPAHSPAHSPAPALADSPAPSRMASAALSLALFALLHHFTDCRSPSRPPWGSPPLDAIPSATPRTATLQGLVASRPTPSPSFRGQLRSEFRLTLTSSTPPSLPKNASLQVLWTGPPPGLGDHVELRAALHPIPAPRNPGQFDSAHRRRRERLWLEAEVFHALDTRILEKGQPNAWDRLSTASRQALDEQLGRGLEAQPRMHDLLSSMILGLPAGGLREWREMFRNTGTLHLFAVSGLNLSMLSGLLGTALRLSLLPERSQTLLLTGALLFYAIATGLSASCVRALVMAVLVLGTVFVAKPVSVLNSLGAAALLLLASNTNTLFDWGFQLSFALVLTLVLLSPPLTRLLLHPTLPDPLLPRPLWSSGRRRFVQVGTVAAQACAVTLAAWLGSLPWALWAFEQISFVGLLANLLAAPIAFTNMAIGFAALCCAPLGPLTPWLNQLNASCAQILLACLQWSSHLPAASVPVPSLRQAPELAVLDLQGAPCVLLRNGPHFHLLDCGSRHQTQSVVLPALRQLGVDSLTSLILCRPAAESIGGTLDLLEQLPTRNILDSPLKSLSRTRREIHEWIEAIPRPVTRIRAGDRIDLGHNATLEVLYPPFAVSSLALPSAPSSKAATTASKAAFPDAGGSIGPHADDKGLVLRFCSPEFSLLYTACAGFPTEQWLLRHRRSELAADIWVRGWHGREPTGSREFLEAVHPRAVIVSTPPWRRSFPTTPSANGIPQETVLFDQTQAGAVLGRVHRGHFQLKAFLSRERSDWPLPGATHVGLPP